MRSSHHPLLRRLAWQPLLVAIPFAYYCWRVLLGRPGPMQWAALAFLGFWLGLSIFDWATGHRLLDWMYPAAEPTARLVSFVALLREPVNFDPAVLARVAGRAWNADLGDAAGEGPDGFAAGAGPTTVLMHDGRMVLVHSFPRPYTDDTEETAASIADVRTRELFRQHQGWFSCDAMGVEPTASAEEVRDCYQRLAKLFVELLDDNCLLIYLPDSQRAFPINEDTEAALRSTDPLCALQDTLTVPMIEIAPDDPLMLQAVEEARQGWPTFVAAYEAKSGSDFSVKAPVSYGDKTEFIWITVTSLEGERVYGELANQPADLGPLMLGSKVSVPVADLNDWCFHDAPGTLAGGFTIAAIEKAQHRRRP